MQRLRVGGPETTTVCGSSGLEVAEVAGQVAALDGRSPGSRSPSRCPPAARPQRHAVGRAVADVLDGDRERGRLAREDRAVVGGLRHLDVRAVDEDVAVVIAAPTQVGEEGDVVDGGARGRGRGAHDPDRRRGAHRELGGAELQDARLDGPAGVAVGGVDGPGQAGIRRQGVVDRDGEGVRHAGVGHLDVEGDPVGRVDLRVDRGLRDRDGRAVDDDRRRAGVVRRAASPARWSRTPSRCWAARGSPAASVSPETFTVRTAPAPRSPNEQVRTPPVIEQPAVWVVHTIPAGSVSLEGRRRGRCPGRCWSTVIVQAAISPALIGLLSAVLTTWRSGPSTTTWSVSRVGAVVGRGHRRRVGDRAVGHGRRRRRARDVDGPDLARGEVAQVAGQDAQEDAAGAGGRAAV